MPLTAGVSMMHRRGAARRPTDRRRQADDPLHQGIETASLQPASEPAIDGAPRRETAGQRPPRAAHAQVPGQRCDNPVQRGAPRRARRVRPLQPSAQPRLPRPPSPCLSGAPHAVPDAPWSTSTPSHPAVPDGPADPQEYRWDRGEGALKQALSGRYYFRRTLYRGPRSRPNPRPRGGSTIAAVSCQRCCT